MDTFIGVPGGAISPVYDALVGLDGVRVVHARHESAAMFMAIGYARMRPDALPCVLTTSGPGVTNSLTGLAAAFGESAPVLVLGGEVPTSKFGRGALQEGARSAIDVLAMVASVTVAAEELTLARHVPHQIARAARLARSGRRGPVFMSLPLDVAVALIEPAPAHLAGDAPLDVAPPEALMHAAELLNEATRPLLLVGSGARRASTEVAQIADRIGCPVMTSPKAKGLVSERDPRCLGVFGYGGHASALEWLQSEPPDVVLAVGCGLNEVSTNSWSSLVQGTRAFVQIDVDARQFGRNYRTDVALLGDAAATLRGLHDHLRAASRARGPRGPMRYEVKPPVEGTLSQPDVLRAVQAAMPDDTVFAVDIGEHLLWAIHFLEATLPDQFVAALGLGSMGSGIGAAIGAKLGAPDRPVVAICGDFGWQMYGMDLSTCVEHELDVVFVVMNDHRMRMVEAGIDRIYGRGLPMDGTEVDFAAAARAHGAAGVTVRSLEALDAALLGRPTGVPLVLDVRVDPTQSFPVNARVAEISNFAAE